MAKAPLINQLTGLRALAALWVVLFHFIAYGLPELLQELPLVIALARCGDLGVDLFFVLSGFIITYSYFEAFKNPTWKTYLKFLWLRLARIYPVHLATIGFLLLLMAGSRVAGVPLNNPENYGFLSLLQNIALVHAWGVSETLSWNYPSWSISAEWFAYLAFPAFAWVLIRFGRIRQELGVLLCCTAVVSFFTIVPLLDSPIFLVATKFHYLFRVCGEFLAGCFLYQVYASRRVGHASSTLLASLLGLAIPALAIFTETQGVNSIWLLPLFPLFILSLARSDGGVTKLLMLKPMIFLGEASYSLYMTHALSLMIFKKVLDLHVLTLLPLTARIGTVVLALLAMVGVASAVYVAIENPARDAMRRAYQTFEMKFLRKEFAA